MAKLKVMTYGNPVLREKAAPVKRIDGFIRKLVQEMIETMHHEDGIGLAAPQVGKLLNLFVIDLSPIEKDAEPMVFINPKITETYGEAVYKEGCLSVPGISTEVTRPDKIKLRYIDIDGKPFEGIAEGLLARVIQHEYDHLRGTLFVDYLSAETKGTYQSILNNLEEKNQTRKKPVKSRSVLA
jgi:peptide deformylase